MTGTPYDAVAATYDEHFDRPVDRWEDDRLARLLRPHVEGGHVLDLGCGTGWLLDHLEPASYIGVDPSTAMLGQLVKKHPSAEAIKASVGELGWELELPPIRHVTVVTATWSAHELGSLHHLLTVLGPRTVRPHVILHGQSPRYAHRDHYVLPGDRARNYRGWRPDLLRDATPEAWRLHGFTGTGAWPDRWPLKPLWALTAPLVPAAHHYAFLGHWSKR